MYDFLGKWQIHRTITQRHNSAPQIIKVVGQGVFNYAEVESDPSIDVLSLDYSEQVQVYLPTAEVTARQQYRYQLSFDKIAVYFLHGGLFHTVSFLNQMGEGKIEATPHLCGKDYYKTHYVFRSFEEFDLEYEVLGPSKNYRSYTQFRRCPNY